MAHPTLPEAERHAPGRERLAPARARKGLSNGMPFRLLSDDRLARCASRGDRQAVAAIFERYQQELYRFCLGLLGEPQDAQDAVQNTVLKVLRALPGEERRIELKPWLYRIAHNEAIELRRKERPTEALDDYPMEVRSSLAEQAEAREQLGWLLNDLDNLPERQRAVLVMRELSGLDFVEIGAALGTSGTVVRQSLYEARRSLQRMDFGRNLKCEVITRALSDADGRVTRRKDMRAHLRACADCRQFQDAIQGRKKALAAISPMPAAAAADILQAASGASAGLGGGGLITAAGFGAVKSVGAPGIVKLAATAAAVAAVGTASVDQAIEPVAPKAPLKTQSAQSRDLRSASQFRIQRDAGPSDSPLRPVSSGSPSPPRPASIEGSRWAAAAGSESRGRPQPSSARTQIAAAPVSGDPATSADSGGSMLDPDLIADSEPGPQRLSPPAKDHPSQSAKGAPAANGSSKSSSPKESAAPKSKPVQAPKPENVKPEPRPHPEQSQKPVAPEEPAPAPEEQPRSASPEPPGQESATSDGSAKGTKKHSKA